MSVMRYDSSANMELDTKAVVKEDGSIEARSIITSIGVFPYRMKDGSIRRELRTKETVFDEAFLETVKNMPIYVGHKSNPDGSLIKDPVRRTEMAVGRTDDAPIGDNVFLSTGIRIERDDGLEAVRAGMRALSVGYVCDIVKKSGVYCGMPYDVEQTNLRGDHLALVRSGRQGDQAVLRMDSDDAILVEGEDATVAVAKIDSKEAGMADNMKTVKLDDGVSYEAEAQVIAELNMAKTKLDSVQKELDSTVTEKSKIEATRDSLKERLDNAEKEVAELKAAKMDEAVIEARVAKRLLVLEAAKKAEIEVKADMSEGAIMNAVILNAFPTAKLDEANEAYVAARFDCALEVLDARKAIAADASVRVAGVVTHDSVDANSAESARKKMLDDMQNRYKLKK